MTTQEEAPTTHKEAQHTPGPWEIDESQLLDNAWAIVPQGQDMPICHVEQWKDSLESEQEALANARLIAAAPALLEWCRRILDSHLTNGAATNGTAKLCPAFADGLAAALAQAVGETQ